MEKLEGIVVYTIERNGCLNAVYVNNKTKHEVFNEIAKLIEGVEKDKVAGTYLSSWVDNGKMVNGELKIVRGANFYQVDWHTGGKHVFTGKGFVTGPHQFTVSYTGV